MFEKIKTVYEHLEDNISKEIFFARLKYSVTGEMGVICDIPGKYRNLSADIEEFYERLRNIEENFEGTIAIFGAGANGKNLSQLFRKKDNLVFVDNYLKSDEENGMPVYTLEAYMNEFEVCRTIFIISVSSEYDRKEIEMQLLKNGVEKGSIIQLVNDWRNNSSQYFDFFQPRQNETFVDCGCYDGATVYRFIGWCGGLGYHKIHSFEPDNRSYKICKKILRDLHDCEVYPYGLSCEAKKVAFLANGREDARIIPAEGGDEGDIVEVVSLDDFLGKEKITFIKMDIEGAEYDALCGASEIIKKQKPRLAISIYHNVNHFIEIPQLLLTLRPDYKIWMRQYSLLANEMILYAE